MFRAFMTRLSGARAQPKQTRQDRLAVPQQLIQLRLREQTTFPLPDWRDARAKAPKGMSANSAHQYWSDAAISWLRQLQDALGGNYRIESSDNFLLLSNLSARRADLLFGFSESVRRRILRQYEGIAASSGAGKHVVIIFDDDDQYYRYVSNYYPETGQFAMSSGMFIQAGYGHFVLVNHDINANEPTIVHELTHCLLAHRPIPTWLNEGLAVCAEEAVFPATASFRGMYSPKEMAQKHAAFWDAHTIQEFWSGNAYDRPDEGSTLAYDLGLKLTHLITRDYATLRAFANAAHRKDAGESAAQAHVGDSLQNLLSHILGPGEWAPQPHLWIDRVKSGQVQPISTQVRQQ